MKSLLTILLLFMLLSPFCSSANKIPKLNLEIGRTYKIATTYLKDSSSTSQYISYEKCIYALTPIEFNKKHHTYKIQIVLDFYKNVVQLKKKEGQWEEKDVYETGYNTPYLSELVNLNKNRVKMYVDVNNKGIITDLDLSDYENYKSKTNLPLEITSFIKSTLRIKLQELFFHDPSRVKHRFYPKVSIVCNLVEKNNQWTKLKIKYNITGRKRDELTNVYWIDNKTGLIREKRYVYQNPHIYDKNFFALNAKPTKSYPIYEYQRYIPEFSEAYNATVAESWFARDKVIENTNAIICGEIEELPDSTAYLEILCGGTNYRLSAKNKFRLELNLLQPTSFFLAAIKTNKWANRGLGASFAIAPGDSLNIRMKSFEDLDSLCVEGFGSKEAYFHFQNEYEFRERQNKATAKRSYFGLPELKRSEKLAAEKTLLEPDFYLRNLFDIVYGYSRSKLNTSEQQTYDSLLLINNSLAVHSNSYLLFLTRRISNKILPEISKIYGVNYIGNKQSNDRNYNMAKVVLNEPVAGYYVRNIVHHGLVRGNWNDAKNLYEKYISEYGEVGNNDFLNSSYERIKATAPGASAPMLAVKDVYGNDFDLSYLGGKVVLVTIYNAWWNNNFEQFERRDTTSYENDDDLVNIHLISGTKDQCSAFAESYTSKAGEIVLFADRAEMTEECFNWLRSNKKILLIGRNNIIKSAYTYGKPGVAEIEAALDETYEPLASSINVKTTLAIVIVLAIILAAVVVFLIYRFMAKRRIKRISVGKRMQELENRAIRSQMNPHFVYNALNSIQALINRNEVDSANLYLSKFAILLRRILKNSEQFLIPLSDELDLISMYCEIEQLRLSFDWEIKVDKELEPDMINIPGMLIQPLIENSIVHGLSAKEGEKRLQLALGIEGNKLLIEIADNGVGFSTNYINGKKKSGFGIRLVKEKLEMMRTKGKTASFNIVEMGSGAKTRIELEFNA